METTEVSIDGWMDKENVVYIYNGIVPSHKKEWNLAICYNMDGPWGHYAEWNKSDKERKILYDLTLYVQSKKAEWYRKQIGDCQRPGGQVGLGRHEMGEGGQKVQTSTYKINKFWEYNIQLGDYS